MTRWERALYGGRLLPAQQQAELESLVSLKTGRHQLHFAVGDELANVTESPKAWPNAGPVFEDEGMASSPVDFGNDRKGAAARTRRPPGGRR